MFSSSRVKFALGEILLPRKVEFLSPSLNFESLRLLSINGRISESFKKIIPVRLLNH